MNYSPPITMAAQV